MEEYSIVLRIKIIGSRGIGAQCPANFNFVGTCSRTLRNWLSNLPEMKANIPRQNHRPHPAPPTLGCRHRSPHRYPAMAQIS